MMMTMLMMTLDDDDADDADDADDGDDADDADAHPLRRQGGPPAPLRLLDPHHPQRVGEVGGGAPEFAHQRPFRFLPVPAQHHIERVGAVSEHGCDIEIKIHLCIIHHFHS